jgi:UPF0755 protein
MASKERAGGVRSFLLFVGFLLALAALAVGVGGYFAWREASRDGPLERDAIVMIEPGLSVSAIGHRLGDAGAVRYPELFVAAVRLKNLQGSLKAGEYRVPARSSVLEIVDLLVQGKSILHFFTAPEGLTSAQILRLIAANPVLVGETTLAPAEGTLLPETYAFTRGQTRDGLIRSMQAAQKGLLDEIWDERALELPINTREQAIILASIIEKETSLPEERGRIAAVFVNRLKRGMRLESDPTVIYGLTQGEPLGRGLRVSELQKDTPYNTYVRSGLPPTPIANPGRASIEAALNPADTDDLFFVADGSGGHAFAATLAEHNRNVAAWRKTERAAQTPPE